MTVGPFAKDMAVMTDDSDTNDVISLSNDDENNDDVVETDDDDDDPLQVIVPSVLKVGY